MKRTTIAVAALAVTSVIGLSACARPIDSAAVAVAVAAEPTAPPTVDDTPPDPELSAEPETGGEAGVAVETPAAPATPIPEPTVAKTQRWVKIYSGPSRKDIEPPTSIRTGSKTVELTATENAQIGTYVTDGAGRTLYRFDKDSNQPPQATCNGDCAQAWPPLLIKSPGKIFPAGLDPKILGYVERADGTCQVTINGWPVYYFAKDTKPGDILGQGVNGTWFAVNPKGGKTQPLPDSIQPAPEGAGSGD
ncbi:hypothetical protein [Actinoplanes sp. NPDC051859]|uniref:hypothetical protein n=1 Tax=Actinoplanes sp. NPDC051859 TaxID=3363909 RepID=UPI0037A10281